jgi:AsmA protein
MLKLALYKCGLPGNILASPNSGKRLPSPVSHRMLAYDTPRLAPEDALMKWNSGRLWLRIAVYGSGSVLALFVLIQALIFWQFDEAAVRKTLSSALNDTGRQVAVEGKITPLLFPSPGLSIHQLNISEPGSKQSFARVEQLDVYLSWIPLLTGNREIKALELHGVTASIARGADGRLSIMDLLLHRFPAPSA